MGRETVLGVISAGGFLHFFWLRGVGGGVLWGLQKVDLAFCKRVKRSKIAL